MRRIASATIAGLLAALCCAPAAPAASRLVVKGHGFGHGIGMSQYGALGYAQHGFGYADILSHYYEQTTLAPLGTEPDVRVLLETTRRATITGAVAAGTRKLSPTRSYSATQTAGRITLWSTSGKKRLGTYDAPLRFVAPDGGTLQLRGLAANGLRDGRYRGAFEIRPAGSGSVLAINAVDLEDYVRGVVSAESPASWPAAALQAQAVVARTYAVTTNVGTPDDGIDQYADTRSQMYKGVAAEYPSTDAAVAATNKVVVTEDGNPVVTYFFSTSGGHTENVEFSFIGALPRPWLKGVDDPFDDISPKHTWQPFTFTGAQVQARLKGLVRGRFEGIKVLERGTSPRIVRAEVAGSAGVTQTTGPELRRRFGLYDTWATFTWITSNAKKPASPDDDQDPSTTAPAAAVPPSTGGITAGTAPVVPNDSGGAPAAAARVAPSVLTGIVDRATAGRRLRVQRREDGRWRTVGTTRAGTGGRYRAPLPGSGTYRVVFGDIAGPAVDIR